jgi:uncharacterized protein with von Willebrand factor type A (vWA) domain
MQKSSRGELFSHLLWFSRRLKEKGVKITTGRVIDALRGLSFIDLSLRPDFADTLKTNFVSSRNDIPVFEALFEEFWGWLQKLQPEQAVPRENEPEGEGEGEKGEKESDFDFLQEDSGAEDEGEEEKKQIWSYSPQEKLMVKDFREFSFEETSTLMREFQRLIAQWVMRMSRRKTPSSTGREMDFRRTIRRTVRHGGEILELVRRRPKQKPLKIIVLCDVSGSMDPALTFVLQFFFTMQRTFRNSETFVFSTRLTRITDILKRNRWPEALKAISQRVQDWSGGTRIGACLDIFNDRYMKGLAAGSAVLIFISDGWDRGEPEILGAEMKRLKRRARRIIWMNPLLNAPDYEPLCLGMRTALPYVDHFLPVHNLLALKTLGETLITIPRPGESV